MFVYVIYYTLSKIIHSVYLNEIDCILAFERLQSEFLEECLSDFDFVPDAEPCYNWVAVNVSDFLT